MPLLHSPFLDSPLLVSFLASYAFGSMRRGEWAQKTAWANRFAIFWIFQSCSDDQASVIISLSLRLARVGGERGPPHGAAAEPAHAAGAALHICAGRHGRGFIESKHSTELGA